MKSLRVCLLTACALAMIAPAPAPARTASATSPRIDAQVLHRVIAATEPVRVVDVRPAPAPVRSKQVSSRAKTAATRRTTVTRSAPARQARVAAPAGTNGTSSIRRPVRAAAAPRAAARPTGRLNVNLVKNLRPRPVPEPQPKPVTLEAQMLEMQQRAAAASSPAALAEAVYGAAAVLPLPTLTNGPCYATNQFTIASGALTGTSFGFGRGIGSLSAPPSPLVPDANALVFHFFRQSVFGNVGAPFAASGGLMNGLLVTVVLWSNPAVLPTVYVSTCAIVLLSDSSGPTRIIGGTFEGLAIGLPGKPGFSTALAQFRTGADATPPGMDFELSLASGRACTSTTPMFDLAGNAAGLLSAPTTTTSARGSLPVGVVPAPAPCPGLTLGL